MRLSGCERCEAGAIRPSIQNALGEPSLPRAVIVVPHDVMAAQHGIAAVLQGVGCPPFCAGAS